MLVVRWHVPVSAVIRVSTGWRLRMMLGSSGWVLPNYVGLHVVLTLDIVIILVIIVVIEIILIALIIIIKVLPSLLPMPAILPGCRRCRWPRMRWWGSCGTPIVTTPVYRPRSWSIIVIGLGTGLAIGWAGPGALTVWTVNTILRLMKEKSIRFAQIPKNFVFFFDKKKKRFEIFQTISASKG